MKHSPNSNCEKESMKCIIYYPFIILQMYSMVKEKEQQNGK
jgi:hypothetical protein